jgi:hypothetical protein
MHSTKSKIEEVVEFLEGKINEDCQTTFTDYCQLEIYTTDKKEAKYDDYEDDCYFLIVDRATRTLVGTISANQDDNYHNWIMVNGVLPKNKMHQTLQSRLFNDNVVKVNQLSDTEFTIQDSDLNYYISKSKNIINRIQFYDTRNIAFLTFMLTSISVTFWIPILYLGTNIAVLLFPSMNIVLFFAILTSDEDIY